MKRLDCGARRPKHGAGVLSVAWAQTLGAGEGSLLGPEQDLGMAL